MLDDYDVILRYLQMRVYRLIIALDLVWTGKMGNRMGFRKLMIGNKVDCDVVETFMQR